MRIGVVGTIWPDSFADNVSKTLPRMGHEAFELGTPSLSFGSQFSGFGGRALDAVSSVAQRALPQIDRRVQRRLVDQAIRKSCDVVISLDARLDPQTVARLRDAGIKSCLWFPDSMVNLGRFISVMAPYDALFFKEPILVERLRDMLSLPIYYLPEACNSHWHTPPGNLEIEPVIAVLGQMYPSRVMLLRRMVRAGLPLRIYGPTFPRWLQDPEVEAYHTRQTVLREDKAATYRRAAVVLNNLHPGEVWGLNTRIFEATASGGAVLTEWRQALPDLFEDGTEVLSFRTFDELVDQARVLLSSPERSRQIGDAGSARSHSDHTFEQRIAEILKILC